ncbi:disulfide bond formation protein DsbA [Serinibacter arcticus]|uniref:Disulfide bond formation protein DsbA n=1 Tax=Serinibacter arcticus TaxID=1655435 RepID=A0A2U1ZXX5_9MICO|nr:DsbA family oxidoreductase [Serinibacter arcticus]PWD51845.1 disulfide bond formation protein DsbA [Serinibacter arcticus]
MSEPLKVEIWSDVQCPWCFIGKRRFETALATSGEDVEITYRSFELAPDTPVDFDGTPADYLSDRKGISPDQARAMMAQVTEIAAEEGLAYDFDHVHQTNTVLAHELLHHAKAHGRQAALKERLLAAYFEEGRHVGRVDELVALAVEVGLDGDEARAALTDHRHLPAVKADVAQAVAYGIRGVPFFVIDGAFGVSGAQTPDVFEAALAQARAARQPQPGAAFGVTS